MSRMHMHRAQLEDAKSVIQNDIIKSLTDDVERVIEQMIQDLGSDTWMGWGADSFQEDCEGFHIPKNNDLREGCETLIQSIDRSIEMIDEADRRCQQQAQELAEAYRELPRLLRFN